MGCGTSSVRPNMQGNADAEPLEREEAASEYDSDLEDELGTAYDVPKKAMPVASGGGGEEEEEEFAVVTEEADGEKFMAVKPWMGAIVPPSDWDEAKGEALGAEEPAKTIRLSVVHGYRCFDSRANLHFNSEGALVYPAAGVVVVRDGGDRQRFYKKHTDDVVSLARHPEGILFASGQVGKSPRVHIWDSSSLEQVKGLPAVHQRAIVALAWSGDGKYLASVGMGNDHTVAVWDHERGKMVGTAKGGVDKILHVCFDPNDSANFVTVGVKHVRFWSIDGGALSFKKGLFGSTGSATVIQAVFGPDGVLLTGTAAGGVLVWRDRKVDRVVKDVHKGGCLCLAFDGDTLISGGKDGKVCVFDSELQQPNASWHQPKPARGINALAIGNDGSVAIGTRNAEVLLFGDGIDQSSEPQLVTAGHFRGEVWGLAIHPQRQSFATVGDDCYLRIWDIESKVQVSCHKLVCGRGKDAGARAVAYSPDASHLAYGTRDGKVYVLDAKSYNLVTETPVFNVKKEISDIKYSPDGRFLAVGSHARNIELLAVGEGYAKVASCVGHSSYITHIDWSADSEMIQSNCGAYELLFWNTKGEQLKRPSDLRDVEWATWTCVMGWPVQGIYPPFSDGTDVNAVSRSNDGTLLASGDDFGKVNLFNYPVAVKEGKSRAFSGHSSHVTNVRWINGDEHVVSVGGMDNCVMVWRVE